LPRVRVQRRSIGDIAASLRGQPDLASPLGRSAERHRRVALSAISSGLVWATSVVTGLVMVPVVLHYLGAERYGVFATITAIAGLVGWADLGLGNGLISEVAVAQGRDDSDSTARAVSTAFFALLGLAVVLAAGFAAVYPFVPWESIFNVSGDAASGVGAAAAAFAVGVFLALPLGVVQRAEVGMQEMFVANVWQAMGRLLGLAGIILAVAVGASLPYLVLALAVAPALALAGNGVDLFFRRRPWLRPSLKRVERDVAGALLRIGSLFFVLQIAIAVAYESDALVLTQILGPTAVTTYSVTMRVFLVVPALANFVLAPLWPAYGEAISRGDVHWVRQTLRRAIRGGLLLTVPGAAVLALVARPFIAAWAGVESPYLLICAAAIWVIVMTLGAVIAAFLNGARVIRAQIVAAVTMMIANLGLSIVFTHWLGVSGVIWGSIAAEGAVVVVLLVVVVPSVVSRLESRQPLPS